MGCSPSCPIGEIDLEAIRQAYPEDRSTYEREWHQWRKRIIRKGMVQKCRKARKKAHKGALVAMD